MNPIVLILYVSLFEHKTFFSGKVFFNLKKKNDIKTKHNYDDTSFSIQYNKDVHIS